MRMTEIQIPYTFQHFSSDESDRFVSLQTVSAEKAESTRGVVINGEYKSR